MTPNIGNAKIFTPEKGLELWKWIKSLDFSEESLKLEVIGRMWRSSNFGDPLVGWKDFTDLVIWIICIHLPNCWQCLKLLR